MNMTIIFATTIAAMLLSGFNVEGQSYFEYKFVFDGMDYHTDGSGNIVGTPMTDRTML
jgi:hypothetical protein